MRGLEDYSRNFRHGHATKTCGGSGSVELCSDPSIISCHGTDVDDESGVERKFTIISATKPAVNILHTTDKLVSYRVIKRGGLIHLLKFIDEWRENGASEISVRVYKYLLSLLWSNYPSRVLLSIKGGNYNRELALQTATMISPRLSEEAGRKESKLFNTEQGLVSIR